MTMPGDETYESGTTYVVYNFVAYSILTRVYSYFGQNLVNAVNSGQVSQARLTVSSSSPPIHYVY